MADGDDQFTRGVQDGYDDAPLYRWQDPFYQERYETGYTLGRWQRITGAMKQAGARDPTWDEFEARMKRRGLERVR